MDKLASRLNKAVTRAGGGINNMIAAKALKELGWTHELADQVEVLKRELVEEKRSRELAVTKAWEFADRIKELEAQVDRLRAAMYDMTAYISRADYYYMEPATLEVLREVNG